MRVSGILLFMMILFIIVIISLFIELGYNKQHAMLVFVAPDKLLVIKGKQLKQKDDIIIYNTSTCSRDEALAKVAKTKRSRYRSMNISKHLSKKITKPFDDSYAELKNTYAENMPVSFIYKTATSIVDVAHNFITTTNEDTEYKALVPNDTKRVMFYDDGNIYVK